MINLNDMERRQQYEWLSNSELVRQAFYSIMGQQKSRVFDGYIHSSKLDWTKPYEKQFQDHVSNYRNSVESLGYTRAGDVYHSDIQSILRAFFGSQNFHSEYRFKFDQLKLQGTVDSIALNTQIGNVLFEFKTTTKLQRDKTGGESIIRRLEKFLEPYKLEQNEEARRLGIERNSSEYASTSSNLAHRDMQEIRERMLSRTRITKPEDKHETQMFTYLWALSNTFKFDWAALIYICRDSYDFIEYWYPIASPESQGKIQKAAENFAGVYQCLNQYQNTLNNGLTGAAIK